MKSPVFGLFHFSVVLFYVAIAIALATDTIPHSIGWVAIGVFAGYAMGRGVAYRRWKRTGKLP